MTKPSVIITMGDPAGIGPEIIGKAVRSAAVQRVCQPLIVGDISRIPGFTFLEKKYHCASVHVPSTEPIIAGRWSAVTGKASYEYILNALRSMNELHIKALVTAPISKEAIHAAGVAFPGHTEMLAAHAGVTRYGMMMSAGELRTIMVTRHIPVCAVGAALTVNEIVETTRLAWQFLTKQVGIRTPRIGICALNPHAGEAGHIGREEITTILPAINKLRALRMPVHGPLGADSAWQHHAAGQYDMLITMYHDQAMIPLKCLAPEGIVNTTLGLPFVRTSPGHGTAFDIAGKNKADPRPMIAAILHAVQCARLSR